MRATLTIRLESGHAHRIGERAAHYFGVNGRGDALVYAVGDGQVRDVLAVTLT